MASEAVASSPSRVAWIREAGKEVLCVDLSQATVVQSLAALEDFERGLKGRAQASVLVLTDLTGNHYNASAAARWKAAFKAAHASSLRASAVFGASGIVGVALRGYLEALRLLGSPSEDIGVFKTRPEALAWLLQR